MNPEQALNQVEVAISNRPPSATNKWYLTFADGKFTLQPTRTEPAIWPILFTLSEEAIRHGLFGDTWFIIKTRVAKLIMIGAQICPPQKR